MEEFACEMQKVEQAVLTGIPGSMAGWLGNYRGAAQTGLSAYKIEVKKTGTGKTESFIQKDHTRIIQSMLKFDNPYFRRFSKFIHR